ncbi:hypothetical protein [Noviherbaspirillum sp. UKPF54]|uniref:hypothetical protein n=1 Tax=Noviherbaspirillum sp. UKPF54 TaxID=2601898 RepID=UPI001FED5648|nr:hypothetical protein [Noviherbaspirillum sp. UKPF54]
MAISTSDTTGMLTALFTDRDSAERAYQVVSDRGYAKDDINVVMSDETRSKQFSQAGAQQTELGNKAAEGAGIGGAVGGTLGAILAAVAATGTSLALPGLGLVIAGPIAAALAGAGAGAATGGLLGALVGWGIPEERVKHYESGIKQGGILIGVRPRSEADADYIEQQWRSLNGQHIYRPASTMQSTSTVRTTTTAAEPIGTTADDASEYRRHWQSAYGTSGGRYEDYDSAYRYGSTMAGSERYQNYQWNDVEPQLRSDWEANHPESTWDKVKDAVRFGAERVSRRH